MDKHGIPLLSKMQLENYAERLLQDFMPKVFDEAQPVDMDTFITNYMEFGFEYQYLSHNGVYLGSTIFEDTDRFPIYNPELNQAEYHRVKANTILIEGTLAENPILEHRERFTQAHEAAHGLLHQDYFTKRIAYTKLSQFSEDGFQETPPELNERDTSGRKLKGEQWLEWQANYLGAALLMPQQVVDYIKSVVDPHRDVRLRGVLVRTLVNIFNVSPEAARVRLECLGHIDPT